MLYEPMVRLSDPVHFTNLRNMDRSPAHYRASILEPREQTPAMRLGTIIHAAVLGEPLIVWDGERRGKEWLKFAETMAKDRPGVPIANASEYERAKRCAEACAEHPEARRMLQGDHEVTRRWTAVGRPAAGRIDVVGAGCITELKSSTTAQPEMFLRAALRMGYHAQLAWYLDGLGRPEWEAHMVVVETAPPFAVTTFTLTRRSLEEGRKRARGWLERLLVCESANDWPAYAQSTLPFEVPEFEAPLLIDGEEVEAA